MDFIEEALLGTLQEHEQNELNHPSLSKQDIGTPPLLPLLVLKGRPLFPKSTVPLNLDLSSSEAQLIKSIFQKENRCLTLVLSRQSELLPPSFTLENLYLIGVEAELVQVIPQEGNQIQAILTIKKRVKLVRLDKSRRTVRAETVPIKEKKINRSDSLKAYTQTITSLVKEIISLNPLVKDELQLFLSQVEFSEPAKLTYLIASISHADRDKLQEVLEEDHIKKRMTLVVRILKKELEIIRLQNQIQNRVDRTVSKAHKEYYLKEQLKVIKDELGIEKDEKTRDIKRFKMRIKNKQLSAETLEVFEDEFEKFQNLDPHNHEYGTSRNYLDWLSQLPWNIQKESFIKLSTLQSKLNRNHYGIKDVKQRIMEHMSVVKLCKEGKVKGQSQILCLVGPPGVGKTSIAKSISDSLDRPFFRFSVGGLQDEAEIKGHRRTYVGSMPGKFIQGLKKTGVSNPVILIDEVDKISSSRSFDPASALLEALDPEQNSEFMDHFIDTPVDLSSVLFILTANLEEPIPDALRDRLEIINLSGYITEEKIKIANKHLLPKLQEEMGLSHLSIDFSDKCLEKIIVDYARESGVRSFSKALQKILRAIALTHVKQLERKEKKISKKWTVKPTELEKYLGTPSFESDRIFKKVPIGVANGLAWTAMGGCTLYIEAAQIEGESLELNLTGQAGEVMRESSQIAWTYIRSFIPKVFKTHTLTDKAQVHLHIPEASTPKEGPSAGITMACAMISLFTKKALRSDTAMTGELTLNGRVLPIGGVKEKVMAARRSHMKRIIFPAANKKEYQELPAYMKKGLKTYFVENFEEVYKLAF